MFIVYKSIGAGERRGAPLFLIKVLSRFIQKFGASFFSARRAFYLGISLLFIEYDSIISNIKTYDKNRQKKLGLLNCRVFEIFPSPKSRKMAISQKRNGNLKQILKCPCRITQGRRVLNFIHLR